MGRVTAMFLALMVSSIAAADEIYRWTDAAGDVHYTTKPPHPGATPAALPEILREPAKPVETPAVQVCAAHGGIDCTVGADTDGSVVCYDGYRDAPTRYVHNCSEAEPTVSEVSRAEDGDGFTIVVRNESAVPARALELRWKKTSKQIIPIAGPTELEAHGIAEFLLPRRIYDSNSEPKKADFQVTCQNCSQ